MDFKQLLLNLKPEQQSKDNNININRFGLPPSNERGKTVSPDQDEQKVYFPTFDGRTIDKNAKLQKDETYNHERQGIVLYNFDLQREIPISQRTPHKKVLDNGQDRNYIRYTKPISI